MTKMQRPRAIDSMRQAAAVPVTLPEEDPAEKYGFGQNQAPEVPYAPAGAPQRPRPEKPVRFTLDLDREQHRFLKTYAAGFDAKASEVMRALLDELRADEDLAARVRDRVWQSLVRRADT
jgi:hypothetical protein